jgi:galactokinase
MSEGALSGWLECKAPGRVNILGEHTDYTGGMVLPMTIPFYTHACVRRIQGDTSFFHTDLFEDGVAIPSNYPAKPTGQWSDYPVGVLEEFRKLGIDVPSFELRLHGNVPFGAGLSSSASVEVAACMALLALTGAELSAQEIARLCQRAENLFVGSPCGIMDQSVVTFGHEGHALMLNTRDLMFDLVPMNTGALSDVTVVLVNSEVKHSVATGAYRDRRHEAETGQAALQRRFGVRDLGEATMTQVEQIAGELDTVILKRVRHIVTENARVRAACEAMYEGNAERLGQIMLRGHESMRDDYQITCNEVDFLVDTAKDLPGCFGARMTGGGFGGCTVNLVANDQVDAFSKAITQQYETKLGIHCSIHPCVAVDGALALFQKERR